MASTACVPGEQLHMPLHVYQTCSLPLRMKLQHKQRGLLHRKTGLCLRLLSMQCPGGGRTISPVATWDLAVPVPQPPQPGDQGVCPRQ